MHNRQQIDFLSQEAQKQKIKKIVPTLIVFIIFLSLIYTTRAVISSDVIAEQFGNTSVINQLKHLVSSENKSIKGEEDGRINILLLGIGGENHDGGNLTDTIMIASIDQVDKKMGLLSIPRDLIVPIKDVGWQKINAAHAYGIALDAEKRPQSGSLLAKHTIERISGLDIHYYVKIDFEGFVKIIDALGGIRVEVPASFTDYEYPDENFGYESVHFDEGWQNLSGDEALKYVRSRHGTAGEGSDFARARRQQQILKALQARVLAMSTLLNPNKILAISEIIGKHIETNMEIWELFRLYDIGGEIDLKNLNQIVLNAEAGGLLMVDQTEEGSYLLRPRMGADDFSEIKLAAQNIIKQGAISEKNNEQKDSFLRVIIQNGTNHEGLAARTADKLRKLSFDIANISNAQQRGYEKTVIYNLSDQELSNDMLKIKEALNANISSNIPEFITPVDADLLIIVGEDNV
ncbi:LCP family protein [Patescibacteria group bacterium]|nr:LCP family protein [Patescibacteria group bacterium]